MTQELCCHLSPTAHSQQCGTYTNFETAVANTRTHARVRTNKCTRETRSRLTPLINHFIKHAFLAIKGNRNARGAAHNLLTPQCANKAVQVFRLELTQ